MNQEETRQELEAMEADIFADAIREDAQASIDAINPAETLDIEQDNIEPLVPHSEDSESDTDTTEYNNDNAESSANDEIDEENIEEPKGTEGSEEVSSDTEDNVLESDDTDTEAPEPTGKLSKSKAREAKAWQKIEAEKNALAEEKERIAQEAERINKEKAELEEKNRPITATEYNDLAKHYENEGEYEKAEEVKQLADDARNREFEELKNAKLQTEEGRRKHQEQFWNTANDFISKPENKELMNAESDLGKAVKATLESDPRLLDIVDGFQVATTIAKGNLAVSSLADKNKRIAELENQIAELNKKTSIGSSTANKHNPSPSRSNKSLEQEEAELLNMARKEDAMAGV